MDTPKGSGYISHSTNIISFLKASLEPLKKGAKMEELFSKFITFRSDTFDTILEIKEKRRVSVTS